MSHPLEPTSFQENPYDPAWFDRDFMHSQDGVQEFPNHHCKKTFYVSLPFVKQFRNAIDIGARDGEYARYLQHYFQHVYCFEPRRRKLFPFNVDMKKVTLFNCALGDKAETITMYGGTHDAAHGKMAQVPCFRLDDFGFEDVDYIKVDVEGFEKKVVMGGEQTIARSRPVIVIEQNSVKLEGESEFAAKEWLEARGYRHAATCPRGWDYIMTPV